ncbi:MAG: gliding motility-associated C-terminal domain-containing protein [Bacteroidetes bacterium]|nr:gliding motility-associated C-terminal domain-containing protein [Bacteroidota bacterium]
MEIFPQVDSIRHAAITIPRVSPALKFTENLGQWDDKILFRAQLDGGGLFIEKNCLTFNFYDKKKYRALHHGRVPQDQIKDFFIKAHTYKVNFLGCNASLLVEKKQQGPDHENFFIGNDKAKWKGNVRNYHQFYLRNLYNNVDYEAYTSATGIKYNFYVKPNADANAIQLKYEGVENIKLKNGTLILKLEVNEIVEQKPFAYQQINGTTKTVKCRYVFKNNVLGFEFPNGYDKNYTLVIDPVIIFAAQSGSTSDNFGMTATYDKQGNLYSGGTCFFQGYPTTTGAYNINFSAQPTQTAAISGLTDVVITKYNSIGTSLIYSTYLGGTGTEIVTSLITDSLNNLYLYGATSSVNFPVPNGFDQSFNGGTNISFVFNGTNFSGGTDIYVSKFNAAGTSLLASTYMGGSGNDGINYNNYAPPVHTVFPCLQPAGYNLFNEYPADSLQYNYGDQYRGEIQLDKNLDVYVVSSTKSTNFPILGGFQAALNGVQDAVVFKLANNLSGIIYSTYLGGNKNDAGYSLIVDDTLQVYVTGGTYSTNFPVKPGCYQTTPGGGKADGYLAKINAAGNQLLKATYIGTSSYDQSYFVQSDRIGRIYIFGQSLGNMPVSPGIYSNPNSHQFLMRFNNQLTTLDKSTVFGSGSPTLDISPSAFSVDKCSGSISLTGWGGNFINCSYINNMPVTTGAFQTTPPDGHDFYFMVLQPNFLSLKYGSYFGGNLSEEHVDGGTSRISESGVLYQSICAGCGGNDDFPVTPGAWPGTPGNPNHNSNCNNGVVKFDYQPKVTAAIVTNTIAGCGSANITFTNLSSPGLIYLWNFGGGPNDTASALLNAVQTYTTLGTHTITLLVIENKYCHTRDSTQIIITIYPKPIAAFTSTILQCQSTFSTTNNSTGLGNLYSWNFGDATSTTTLSNPVHTYSASGNYTVTLITTNSFGCKDSIKKPVTVFIFNPGVASGSIICSGETATISASGGTSYTWSPSSQVSNTSIANPVVSPTTSTIYTVTIYNNTGGNNCIATLTTNVTVNPKPTANFNFTINPCGGGVFFNDLSSANITAWQWSLSSTATSTIQNPYYFYTNGGTHTISLIATNSDGCKDTLDQVITVPAPPPVAINAPKIICKGYSAQLSASGGVSYAWTPTLTLDLPNIANPSATPTISTQYSVVITSTLLVGGIPCQFLLTTSVNVTQLSSIPISANANPIVVTTGSATTLTYIGDPGATVMWLPPNSTIPAFGYTVTAYPDRPTTYTAVATLGACKDQAVVTVEAFSPGCIDNDVFVPNTFTPNGDGKNDILFVRGIKVDEVYFAVYNRWGEKVFETTDKTKGWDGIYKSRAADVGVFGWYLKVKCINGEENFKKGNVTLIR